MDNVDAVTKINYSDLLTVVTSWPHAQQYIACVT